MTDDQINKIGLSTGLLIEKDEGSDIAMNPEARYVTVMRFAHALLATPAPLSDEPVAIHSGHGAVSWLPEGADLPEGALLYAAPPATPSDKQEAVSANAADVQRDANRIAYENWEKETADGEFEIAVDSRDLFDVLRACWRDGQSYGESSEQASWSMASDYASKALKEWWNTGAAPLAQSAEQDRIDALFARVTDWVNANGIPFEAQNELFRILGNGASK
jgi:hypothetical protein